MKKSEEIKEKIYLLEKALEAALEEEREKVYLWKASDRFSCDKIGFWDMNKIRLFLTALNNGHTLRMIHASYGSWDVQMNSQKNRILVDYQQKLDGSRWTGPSEDNILNYVGQFPTTCYILEYGS